MRVALISPSALVLAGLRAGLSELASMEVVWAGPTVADWQRGVAEPADVAILDVGADAIQAVEAFDTSASPALVLLVDDRNSLLNTWLEEGMTVLPREASLEMIAGAAHAAAAGLVASSPHLWAGALRGARFGDRENSSELGALTTREREVLVQMALGQGNREIAKVLQISTHTAKFHVSQIIGKLAANSRAHAVAKAVRVGLVE